ncbi:MAG: hypothetical protein V1838_01185 [Patescibacteria group bacterium]
MTMDKYESFAQAMSRAEKLEREAGGITDKVMTIRKWAKDKYPALFDNYLKNRTNKVVGAGEIIHSNYYGKQRIAQLKKNGSSKP